MGTVLRHAASEGLAVGALAAMCALNMLIGTSQCAPISNGTIPWPVSRLPLKVVHAAVSEYKLALRVSVTARGLTIGDVDGDAGVVETERHLGEPLLRRLRYHSARINSLSNFFSQSCCARREVHLHCHSAWADSCIANSRPMVYHCVQLSFTPEALHGLHCRHA